MNLDLRKGNVSKMLSGTYGVKNTYVHVSKLESIASIRTKVHGAAYEVLRRTYLYMLWQVVMLGASEPSALCVRPKIVLSFEF